jgi:hypothetical protein
MTQAPTRGPEDALADIVRDLERQRRISGVVLTVALLGTVFAFRWLNEGPYAGNSVYMALAFVVVGTRAADQQLARAVSRLASLVATR